MNCSSCTTDTSSRVHFKYDVLVISHHEFGYFKLLRMSSSGEDHEMGDRVLVPQAPPPPKVTKTHRNTHYITDIGKHIAALVSALT